jgi:protease PrsW
MSDSAATPPSTAGAASSTTAPAPFLVCIAGPDSGKRLALTTGTLLVGRAADSNVLSDDPAVTDHFARLTWDGTYLHVKALGKVLPFVDGHAAADITVTGAQQLRLGSSIWRLEPAHGAGGVFDFVNRLGNQLSSAAGIETPGEWNAREMFADATKKHSDEEIEAYFTVGTAATTPTLRQIDASWPKPWMFLRVFVLAVVLYLGFVLTWEHFDNENLIPGLIMLGSVAVPLSLLVFFFEVNVPRNVSLYQVIKLVLVGGLLSIAVALVFFDLTHLDNWMGAASAGIIEESAKALTLLLVVKKPRYRWTLNGLLLGATVGTGFAVFESAGYALRAGLESGGPAMLANIQERGFLSVLGGHVLWTGLVGAALWRVRGNQSFRKEMWLDPRFLRVLVICMAMHMLWNFGGISVPYDGKYIILGAAAWLLVLGMIQDGLKQVRAAQAAAARA